MSICVHQGKTYVMAPGERFWEGQLTSLTLLRTIQHHKPSTPSGLGLSPHNHPPLTRLLVFRFEITTVIQGSSIERGSGGGNKQDSWVESFDELWLLSLWPLTYCLLLSCTKALLTPWPLLISSETLKEFLKWDTIGKKLASSPKTHCYQPTFVLSDNRCNITIPLRV